MSVARTLGLALAFVVSTTAQGEALSERQLERVQPVLGDYVGQWNTEASRGDHDDLSRYDLSNSVMRLSTVDGQLRVSFFLDDVAAAANEELDLLGFGCQSSVGAMDSFQLLRRADEEPVSGDEPEEITSLLKASFLFEWGKCPSRVWAFPDLRLQLELAGSEAEGEYLVHLALLHRLVPANQTYLARDGEKHRIEIRQMPGGTHYRPRLQYCVVDEFGETQGCYDRREEVKNVIVPYPVPGVWAVWWTSRDKVEVVKGQRALYHEAVYRKVP